MRPRPSGWDGLGRWLEECARHDADPRGWIRSARERARAYVRAGEAKRGPS